MLSGLGIAFMCFDFESFRVGFMRLGVGLMPVYILKTVNQLQVHGNQVSDDYPHKGKHHQTKQYFTLICSVSCAHNICQCKGGEKLKKMEAFFSFYGVETKN